MTTTTIGPAPSAPTRRQRRSFARIDWLLLLSALALSGIGSLLVWSATRDKQVEFGNDPATYLKRHLLNLAIGVVLGFLVSRFDYRLIRAYTPVLYVVSVFGLVIVLSPLGSEIAGAKAWISLPAGFSVQPSEFAKIAIVLGMAMILSEKRDSETEPRDTDVALALAVAAVPMVLVLLQPDLGTVLVMACAVMGVLAVSGAPTRWVAGVPLAAGLIVYLAVRADLVKDYQIGRLTSFIDPNLDPTDRGFNTVQARIAIGSGGVSGKGLFQGPQTQGGFVPKNNTDFVFSVAGEEFGLIGTALIVGLFGVIIWRALVIARRAGDLFGRLVAVGIACWIGAQAFENIGMNIGIMPVTGVPLPMVSYGGTSMFATWIAIGLLQGVHLRSQD